MKTLTELKKQQKKLMVMHYACTSVKKSPVIVTSISIKNFATSKITTFGMDSFKDEKSILKNFVKFIKNNTDCIFITWNQKSNTYGFPHIEQRCQVHKIASKLPISDGNIIDLDDVFEDMFGQKYAKDPKLKNLATLNDLTLLNFVDGGDEITLYEKKDFKKIENSTNRKVDLISSFLDLTFKNKLKTDSQDLASVSNQNESKLLDAHFFFVDIVGLSDHRLTSAEEQIKKINVLNSSIKSSKTFKADKPDDKMILPTGDGMVIGFKERESPLKLAIELHKKLNKYNKSKSKDAQIGIRIGIYSAPVLKFLDIKAQENFWGEGVIKARRIMDLGSSSHILLSGETVTNLQQLSEYRKILHPIGKRGIKHGFVIGIHSAYGKGFGNKTPPSITKEDKEKFRSSKIRQSTLELQLLQNKKQELIAQKKHDLNLYDQCMIDENAMALVMSSVTAAIANVDTKITTKKLEIEKLHTNKK